jgi:hypothetical protein
MPALAQNECRASPATRCVGERPRCARRLEFMGPMLPPAQVALNRDAFTLGEGAETTVDLEGHRATSGLEDLVLGSRRRPRSHGGEPG